MTAAQDRGRSLVGGQPPNAGESPDTSAAQDRESAIRLLGFALFNLTKGNTAAAETLMRKAYVALTGREWDA